ncbi:Rad52/22 double-strand break repair protein [bacterium]|nr:Rad52/22 double-strand break repair protein [bacterium]
MSVSVFTQLKMPFEPSRVSWRVGSTTADKSKGLALAYIDARDVMNRLDDVMGPDNWQDRYEVHGNKTVCYLSIRCNEGWITKADAAGDSDVEAEKGAISDAFKRAAVKWGIGRYLYDIESPWVELDGGKRIAKHEYARLERLLRFDATDKEAAAVHWANSYAAMRELEADKVGYDGENSAKIAAAAKYPKAKQILMDAGVPF